MINKIKYLFLLLLFIGILETSATSQTPDDETFAVGGSQLTAIDLPAGARQIRDEKIPSEVKETLSKLVAAGGEGIKQGESEVVVWSGNYKKTKGAQMIQNLEAALKNNGWQYEIGEKSDEFTMFTLFRAEPARRALVGFFVPSGEVFVFAVAEMLKTGGKQAENPSLPEKNQVDARVNSSTKTTMKGATTAR